MWNLIHLNVVAAAYSLKCSNALNEALRKILVLDVASDGEALHPCRGTASTTRMGYNKTYISGLIHCISSSHVHARCGPLQSLQFVTSMGLCERYTESLFKAAQSKHMIITSCPSPLGPIIRRFQEPLILLPAQGRQRCFKVALYDTCTDELILALRISMEGTPSRKVIH